MKTIDKAASERKYKRSALISKIVINSAIVGLFIYAISMLIPFIWMVFTSFKDNIDYTLNTFSLPQRWHFDNYVKVFKMLRITVIDWEVGSRELGIEHMALNSLIASGLGSFIGLIQPTLTAYIVSKYRFRGRNFIYALGIFVMILPVYGSLAIALRFGKFVGYYDNLPLLVLLGGSPFGFTFLLLYGAFKNLQWEYAEAAFIDGASHFRVMIQIFFPMMLPTFATLYVLSFIGSWSDYMTTVIWTPSWPTLGFGVWMFQNKASLYGAGVPQILAGFIIIGSITAALYLSAQNLILSKLAVGGLKG